jgi:hypothetical protein
MIWGENSKYKCISTVKILNLNYENTIPFTQHDVAPKNNRRCISMNCHFEIKILLIKISIFLSSKLYNMKYDIACNN